MLFLKYLLVASDIAMMALAAGFLGRDLHLEGNDRRGLEAASSGSEMQKRWRTGLALAILAWAPMLLALGLLVLSEMGLGG